MSGNTFSSDQIRAVVREALLEALPGATNGGRPKKQMPDCPLMKQILETIATNCNSAIVVDVATDRKFNEFLKNLAKCLQDQDVEALILSNRLKFALKNFERQRSQNLHVSSHKSSHQSQNTNDGQSNGRLDSGVLTESKVLALAKTNQCIEIGSKVVLTPLAKDRARKIGLKIVRQ